jgi:hypothetical protein
MRGVTENNKKGKGIDLHVSRERFARGRTPARDFELFLRQDFYSTTLIWLSKTGGPNRSVPPVTTYNAGSVKHLFTLVLSIELGRHLARTSSEPVS